LRVGETLFNWTFTAERRTGLVLKELSTVGRDPRRSMMILCRTHRAENGGRVDACTRGIRAVS
jgi:hypothetical protein